MKSFGSVMCLCVFLMHLKECIVQYLPAIAQLYDCKWIVWSEDML